MTQWLKRYERLMDSILTSSLLEKAGVNRDRVEAFKNAALLPAEALTDEVTWFHAASVGELEILIPLMQKLDEAKMKIGVSVFSESALPALKKIPASAVYAGFSPKESEWQNFFTKFNVKKVVVSKYEAWPGLWAACSVLDLPLILVNAQSRSSLRWVKRFMAIFKIRIPRLHLFTANRLEVRALQNLFPSARVEATADPRWMRVIERSKDVLHHPRVGYYRESFQNSSRPYGMVGSAWIEDLKILVPAFLAVNEPGTLWVVPHSLAPHHLEEMKVYLEGHLHGRYVLVDEMGVLAELYSLADWVWVGGGFGKGIHSTLEPAVYGVPIACGPKRVDEFYETHELRQHGLLTVCRNQAETRKWLESFQVVKPLPLAEKTEGFARLVEQCQHLR